jgi:cytochrome c-type biogenesis protein CcmH
MNGWVGFMALLILVVAGILLFTKARRQLWTPVAAAVVLAMSGYAWQGAPDLPSVPAKPIAAEKGAANALIKMRSDMDQSFGAAKMWLVTADGFARDGEYSLAAAYIQAGINRHPDNADLWSGLGLVLMLAADGELTPPARLAFDKARKLAPRQPAADYFTGLAALFQGRPAETLQIWEKLLERATPKAKWRAPLESQSNGLRQMLTAAAPSANR